MGHTIYWTNWCRISQPSTVWKMSIQSPASYEHIENQGAILYTCKWFTSVPSNFEDLPLHPHICALLFGFPPESITPLCRKAAGGISGNLPQQPQFVARDGDFHRPGGSPSHHPESLGYPQEWETYGRVMITHETVGWFEYLIASMTSRLLSVSSMSIQPETYDAKLAMYIHTYIYIHIYHEP